MGLFRKRRRYNSTRRRHRLPSFWDNLVWAVDPDAMREIISVFLIVFGLIAGLGILGLAGKVGNSFLDITKYFFDILAYIVPFVFIFLGLKLLFNKNEQYRATSIIGIALLFLFIPGIFGIYGGMVGIKIIHLFQIIFSNIGGYVAIVGATIISIMLAFNVSLKSILAKLKIPAAQNDAGVRINTGPRVPVRTMANGPTNPVVIGDGTWEFPNLSLLDYSAATKPEAGNIGKNVEVIKKTLKDFGVEVTMGDVNIGPTLTQYTLKPSEGMKLSNITARSNDIALALAAHPIRIEAPIPGKSLVGIEVPNKVAATVSLREVLESEEYKKNDSNLSLALGRDVAGEVVVADLKKMPHLLIAGATGSGKSVCMNSILVNLLYRNTPNDLRLLLVDPKRVEFTEYNNCSHLLTPVITEVDKTVASLRWGVAEMDRRYQLLASHNRRNIEAFNDSIPSGEQKLPYLIIIIDELADLMTQAANEVEASIVRIAQMARAVGIHLIVATQRPSVDVITGLIKANITSRIAFAVASQVDSRTILDGVGAEKLLGKGDMLYLASDNPQPRRIQGVFLKDKEIGSVTEFVKAQAPAVYDETITTYHGTIKEGVAGIGGSGGNDDDELYNDAKNICVQAGKASASLLQRRLKVGYARAARLLDLLENEGVIGPADGAKPRDVLVAPDEYQGP